MCGTAVDLEMPSPPLPVQCAKSAYLYLAVRFDRCASTFRVIAGARMPL